MGVIWGKKGTGTAPIELDDANALKVAVTNVIATLDISDVEIGAVELKDGSTGNRASVDSGGALKVDGSAVTQPISALALPLPTDAATASAQATQLTSLNAIKTAVEGTLDVSFSGSLPTGVNAIGAVTQAGVWNVGLTGAIPAGANNIGSITVANASLAVTGTFWQATQPVSIAGSVAVTGDFYPVTQPVSITSLPALAAGSAVIGHVIVDSATVANLDVLLSTRLKPADTLAAVTTLGTITNVVHVDDNGGSLTVDGPLTDAQLRLTPVPVSGTVAVTGPLTDTQLRLTPVPVNGTVAITNANLDAAISTRLKPADTLAGVSTVAAVTSITNPVAVTNANLDAALSTRASDAGLATIAANQALASTAALQTTGNTKLDTLIASLAALLLEQGADAADVTGPLVQGQINDTQEAWINGEVRPLSLTPEGRLRVSTMPAYDYLDFFGDDFNFGQPVNIWSGPVSNPWGF